MHEWNLEIFMIVAENQLGWLLSTVHYFARQYGNSDPFLQSHALIIFQQFTKLMLRFFCAPFRVCPCQCKQMMVLKSERVLISPWIIIRSTKFILWLWIFLLLNIATCRASLEFHQRCRSVLEAAFESFRLQLPLNNALEYPMIPPSMSIAGEFCSCPIFYRIRI